MVDYGGGGRGVADFAHEKKAAPWMSQETAELVNCNVKLHNEIVEFV